MGFKCGIVGLPNVGKSTLFCTIDPNVGVVEVPDPRLQKLADIVQPKKIVPTTMEFVDIAGLVAGASKGEGLGNQFLGHIRETDAIAHVVRCFEDDDIAHVGNAVDPLADIEGGDLAALAHRPVAHGNLDPIRTGRRHRPLGLRRQRQLVRELTSPPRPGSFTWTSIRRRCARRVAGLASQ